MLAAGKIERLPCRRAFSPVQIVPIRYKYVLGDSWGPDPETVVPVTLRHSSCPSTNRIASEANLAVPNTSSGPLSRASVPDELLQVMAWSSNNGSAVQGQGKPFPYSAGGEE